MKRLILLVFIAWHCVLALGQTRIVMEEHGGVYKIPCLVNGAKMKMVFDTGAASVCLSQSIAEYLLENEFISIDDFIGVGRSVVADGSTIDNVKLVIKDIEIGGLHLYNVETVVIASQSAPLLLGLSAISKLGRVELNGNTLTIIESNSIGETEDQLVASYLDKATHYVEEKLYYRAVEYYEKVYAMNRLSDFGKYCYSICLLDCDEYTSALKVCESIEDYTYFNKNDIDIYGLIGFVYKCNKMNDESIEFYKKSINSLIPSNTYEKRAFTANCIAGIYDQMKWHDEAVLYYRMALACFEMEWGLRAGYLLDDCLGRLKKREQSYRNDTIDQYAFDLVVALIDSGEWSVDGGGIAIRHMARTGNIHARKFCNKYNLPYNF